MVRKASSLIPKACSFFPLTNNNTSHSRASSMHLTQWLDQTSAVGSLLGELPGQSIRRRERENERRRGADWLEVVDAHIDQRFTEQRDSVAEVAKASAAFGEAVS